MRTTLRLFAPLAALMLLGAACDDDPVIDGGNGDDSGTEETDDNGDEETDDHGDDQGDDQGDEHAEATFNGEEIAFSGVTCGTLPADDQYELRGRIDGGGHLQARFSYDPGASGDDDIVLASDTPSRLELMFPGEGGTIGDSETFQADQADLDQLDASVDHVSGSLHLDPEYAAVETTPDGGDIEFEIRCS